MKRLQTLSKNGNGVLVAVPAAILRYLGWRAGERCVVELLPDRTVQIRRPSAADLTAPGAPIVLDNTLPTTPV